MSPAPGRWAGDDIGEAQERRPEAFWFRQS